MLTTEDTDEILIEQEKVSSAAAGRPSHENPNEESVDSLLSPEDAADLDAILHGKFAESYTPLASENAVDLLEFFHPTLSAKQMELDLWQKEVLLFISMQGIFTKQVPLEFALRTCNGSGKDAFIIAGTALWLTLTKVRHRTVVTTASYTQMKNQTQNYISSLAIAINTKMMRLGACEKPPLIVKRDHVVCRLTGSEIVMFVTDDPQRAEGYHPWPDCPTQELCLITNEAKTIPDEIFEHLRRCTYNRWLEISSPEETVGHFYKLVLRARDWSEGFVPGVPLTRKISAYDCKHISAARIASAIEELGENSPLFRSMYLAEFVSLSTEVVITREMLDKCIKNPPEYNDGLSIKRLGVDLAYGGDENVVYKLENNKLSLVSVFHAEDAEVIVGRLKEIFKDSKVAGHNIYIDDGGIGRVIIDWLWKDGWSVNRVLNQSAAVGKKWYGNLGAELYYNFKRIIEECGIIIDPKDHRLHMQLTTRHYDQHGNTGKLILESKKKARAAGRGSPDRADAAVLSCTGLTIDDFKGKKVEKKIADLTLRYSSDFLVKHAEAQLRHIDTLPDREIPGIRFGNKYMLPAAFFERTKAAKGKITNPFSVMNGIYNRRK